MSTGGQPPAAGTRGGAAPGPAPVGARPVDTLRRQYAITLVLLAVGAALALLALGRPWVAATAGGGTTPQVAIELTGRQLLPAAAGAAVLLLAGAAAVPATRGIGRTVIGAVLSMAALGAIATTVSWRVGAGTSAPRAGAEALGVQTAQVVIGPWWAVAVSGCALALLAALAVCVRGRRWPALGGRYSRADKGGAGAAAGAQLTAAQVWDALDRGEDPTMVEDLTE